MEESGANLICLQAADLRERGEPLPTYLEAHALSCPDCRAVEEADRALARYVPPAYSGRFLWERIERKRMPLFLARLAVAASILLLVGFFLGRRLPTRQTAVAPILQPSSQVKVARSAGRVISHKRHQSQWLPVRAGAAVHEGEEFVIPREAGLGLAFRDGTRINFQGGTRASLQQISGPGQGIDRVFLTTGRVFIRHGKSRLMAQTPVAAVEPVGTSFAVAHEGNRTLVRVFQGEVRVRRTKGSREEARVRRKERLRVVPASPLRVIRLVPAELTGWEKEQCRLFRIPYEEEEEEEEHPKLKERREDEKSEPNLRLPPGIEKSFPEGFFPPGLRKEHGGKHRKQKHHKEHRKDRHPDESEED